MVEKKDLIPSASSNPTTLAITGNEFNCGLGWAWFNHIPPNDFRLFIFILSSPESQKSDSKTNDTSANPTSNTQDPQPVASKLSIVPAQGWIVDAKGGLILVADSSTGLQSDRSGRRLVTTTCQW